METNNYDKMERKQSTFIMPSPTIDDAAIMGMFKKINDSLPKYLEKQEQGLSQKRAKSSSKAVEPIKKTTLFGSQLKLPNAIPSTDEIVSTHCLGSSSIKSAATLFCQSSPKELDQAKRDIASSSFGGHSSKFPNFIESSDSLGNGNGQDELFQKQKLQLLAFKKPTFGQSFVDLMQGNGSTQDKLSQKPKFKPLTFDKPTFGQSFDPPQVVEPEAKVDPSNQRKRKGIAGETFADVKSTDTSLQSSFQDNFCTGYGLGFSFMKPSKEEMDDFVAFADEWIPSVKRIKTNDGTSAEAEAKRSNADC
mmetsp:Transcript_25832/g.44121  ORF Transcript_25832/g.44121 Transcript_25832/m.44121 type:complete len:306 (+) Transcript_25832:78-995(+)